MSSLLDTAELRDPPYAVVDTTVPAPVARSLFDLERPQADDSSELLRSRFLCRHGGLLLVGPTGVGKSSLSVQLMILWAVGRPCFGIAPARPLKSLLIQAENDDGDLSEFRDGICAELDLTAAEIEGAGEKVIVLREDSHTSVEFFNGVVEPALAKHKPDLLWIDPALAYLGGEATSQADVGRFLRTSLNPLLHQHNCAAVIVHHTNKPPRGKDATELKAADSAYLGSGSAEWANWSRAILVLRSLGSQDVFELRAPKRGGRLGWRDADGQPTCHKFIAHAKRPGVICWREANPEEIKKGGRPRAYGGEELVALLPEAGLPTGEWKKLAKEECGASESTFQRERRALAKAGRIRKIGASGMWQAIRKL